MPEKAVFLIEDNCDDEFLAIHTLRKAGFQNVVVARDGQEALVMLLGDETDKTSPQVEPPTFILLDLRLPKVDGLEVLRQVRSAERTKDVPIYVLSSSESPRDKDVCFRLGVLDYLTKPLTYEAFMEALNRVR